MSLAQTQAPSFGNPLTRRIAGFLTDIGLELRAEPIEDETFLPGILIRDGVLIIDESRLANPGDVLHEAGHLAIVTPSRRRRMGANVGIKVYEELTAIAWSWAALKHLGLAPEIVFHANGYKGESQNLIAAFSENQGPGVPCLAQFDLCGDPNAGPDALRDLPPFPTMTRWLRGAETPT